MEYAMRHSLNSNYVVVHVHRQVPGSSLLRVISRLIKYMVSMSSDALSPEHRWEAKTFRNLVLTNALVATFWLTDDEFANL